MTLKVHYSPDDEGEEVTSGWTVERGKSLTADIKSLKVDYEGFKVDVSIKVNNIIHDIPASEINQAVTAPEAGEAPQAVIEGNEKYNASIEWLDEGKKFTGAAFAPKKWYRARVKYEAVQNDKIKYGFPKDFNPEFADAVEILNRSNDGKTMSFDIAYSLADSAFPKELNKAFTLYHKGYSYDEETDGKAYGAHLSEKIDIESGKDSKSVTVEAFEKDIIEKDAYETIDYDGSKVMGRGLYGLLRELLGVDFLDKLSDSTVVKINRTKFKMKDIRAGYEDADSPKSFIYTAVNNAPDMESAFNVLVRSSTFKKGRA